MHGTLSSAGIDRAAGRDAGHPPAGATPCPAVAGRTGADPSPAPARDRSAAPLPVCLAIVACNRLRELRRCLRSVALLRPAVHRVVVVDTGSTDGTPAMLRAEFPWVELLAAGADPGPCVARNLAADRSDEEFLWFLNSDAEIVDRRAAQRLHALFLDDPELAAAGGEALLDGAGRSVGVERLRCGPSGLILADPLYAVADTAAACEVIAGCNLMVRRSDVLAAGGFDPYYPCCEDMDLTWRLRAAGRRLAVLAPMPVVRHAPERRREGTLWCHARSRMYFCFKNLPLRQLAWLPLHDAGVLVRPEALRHPPRRAPQPAAVAGEPAGARRPGSLPRCRGAARAAGRLARMAAVIGLSYLALPRVIGPALLARRLAGGRLVGPGFVLTGTEPPG